MAESSPRKTFSQTSSTTPVPNTWSRFTARTLQRPNRREKPFVMLEMNTASCGGFPGLSDSFGAALWSVMQNAVQDRSLILRMTDYALQMAYGNFSAALMHVGGQNVYYNVSPCSSPTQMLIFQPFTPPQTNLSTIYQWTTGSVYYSTLVVAEALGQSNQSRVVDLTANDNSSIYHPAYAIYENNAPSRLVLFNYVNDGTGASDLQTTITVNGGTQPSSVSVRYLRAPSIQSTGNLTWAGQTMGEDYSSDGRLQGTLDTVSITCNNGQCVVPVFAPSIALVFLTPESLQESSPAAGATLTYSTTVVGTGQATYNPAALQTSNGKNGPAGQDGSTSPGSANAAGRAATPGLGALLVAGVAVMAIFSRTL